MKILWTDGSASPNPGPGGFAVIEYYKGGARPVVLGREKDTTNIRMEGQAMIEAIKYANGEDCEIYTDSEFWINTITKWAPNWEKNGWKKRTGEIKNLDIVQELFGLYKKGNVELIWVRGHDDVGLNEMADTWANKARRGAEL